MSIDLIFTGVNMTRFEKLMVALIVLESVSIALKVAMLVMKVVL